MFRKNDSDKGVTIVAEYVQQDGRHALTVVTSAQRDALEAQERLVNTTEYPRRP